MKTPDEVRALLAQRQMTQAELAARAKVVPGTISGWLNGHKQPRMDTYERIMAILEGPPGRRPQKKSPVVDDQSLRTFGHLFEGMGHVLRDSEISPQSRHNQAYSFCVDCLVEWGCKVIGPDGRVFE